MRARGVLECEMTAKTMADADAIYRAVLDARFQRIRVESPEFDRFRGELRLLRRATAPSREDGFWDTGLRHLGSAGFLIASTPLPANDPGLGLLSILSRARDAF